MKRTTTYLSVFFILLFLQITNKSFSQDAKEFFSNPEAKTTWLGIDFSEVKVMGDLGASPDEMKDKYFEGINDLIVGEPQKYDLTQIFHKTYVTSDISEASKRNSKIDPAKLKTFNQSDLAHVTPEMVDNIVKTYSFGDKKGFGVLFIMESMSKTAVEGSMYFTVINMETKKVVFTKRMTAKPKGFGFRNYWTGCVFEAMKDIEKNFSKM